jgi:alcohol dehydrogenase class IV
VEFALSQNLLTNTSQQGCCSKTRAINMDQCAREMAKVFDQIERAGEKDTKKTDKLYRKMNELAKKLGPEYTALMYGLPKDDPNSQDA